MNNAFKVYRELTRLHTPRRRVLDMPEAINELAHALMQSGDAMRTRRDEHPIHLRDLTNVFDHGTGREIRSDAKGLISRKTPQPPTMATFTTLQDRQRRSLGGSIRMLRVQRSKNAAGPSALAKRKARLHGKGSMIHTCNARSAVLCLESRCASVMTRRVALQ